MSQAKNWVFTINNYTKEDYEQLQSKSIGNLVQYIGYKGEIGESGTKHLQGVVFFTTRKRLTQVIEHFTRTDGCRMGGHFEVMRGTAKEAIAYCKKEETADPEWPYVSAGIEPVSQGSRTDLSELIAAIREGVSEQEVFDRDPGAYIRFSSGVKRSLAMFRPKRSWKTEIKWYWGPTGTGKSRKAFEEYPDAYWKNPGNNWWDGYDGEEVVIIDDYRRNMCTFSELLRLFDRYPLMLQVKGAMIPFLAKIIVVTCPLDPRSIWHGRVEEDLQQLLRRIEIIIEFN